MHHLNTLSKIMKNILILALVLLTATSFAQRKRYKNITEINGNIGIGTTKPDALLTVKGQIHTQEVLVDLEGAVAPDYVFETYFNGSSVLNSDYKFLSLKEVASYIESNHHLPGIPSARQLELEGMELKEMNLILLQKIEELTIYTLEQQKEIDDLKEALHKIER
mgnify:CR=1 FL=1|jgi:hypothetical protein